MPIGRAILAGLAMAGIATAAPARRPVPPEVGRFADALQRGNLRAARAELAPRAAIERDDFQTRRRARLIELLEEVVHCAPAEYSPVSRDLEDPQLTQVHQYWRCSGKPDVSTTLRMRGGRLVAVEFGPPIVPAPATPGYVPPARPSGTVAREFLISAVGERDEGWASIDVATGMEIVDRASGRTVAFSAIADHVERCGLAALSPTGPDAVVSRWTCPDGQRHIRLTVANEKVSRVELAGSTP